jgi:hypothetical protein
MWALRQKGTVASVSDADFALHHKLLSCANRVSGSEIPPTRSFVSGSEIPPTRSFGAKPAYVYECINNFLARVRKFGRVFSATAESSSKKCDRSSFGATICQKLPVIVAVPEWEYFDSVESKRMVS